MVATYKIYFMHIKNKVECMAWWWKKKQIAHRKYVLFKLKAWSEKKKFSFLYLELGCVCGWCGWMHVEVICRNLYNIFSTKETAAFFFGLFIIAVTTLEQKPWRQYWTFNLSGKSDFLGEKWNCLITLLGIGCHWTRKYWRRFRYRKFISST